MIGDFPKVTVQIKLRSLALFQGLPGFEAFLSAQFWVPDTKRAKQSVIQRRQKREGKSRTIHALCWLVARLFFSLK